MSHVQGNTKAQNDAVQAYLQAIFNELLRIDILSPVDRHDQSTDSYQ